MARIENFRHKDKRTNIPTEELRDFVADDEARPGTMLYPRDPSLDPQLVWRGKDEQDREPLAVPVVPVYIQEKVHPRAIVEDVRRQARAAQAPEMQLDLFGDFNNIAFEDLVDFYHHEQNWTNRMVLGDSLLVMTSLAEKEGLKGKVQMIYMDPPYGIKFGSNWQVSTRKRDVKDGKVEDMAVEPEVVKAFRDTWELGIHSYLTYLRDRLVVARELLTESGSVFVQIGSDNMHLVRCLMDEVFGSENFVALVSFAKTSSSTGEILPSTSDYLLCYARQRSQVKYRPLFIGKIATVADASPYSFLSLQGGDRRRMFRDERDGTIAIPEGSRRYRIDNLQSQSIGRAKGEGAASWFPVEFSGRVWRPSARSRWKTNERGMQCLKVAGRLAATEGGVYYVRYLDDFPMQPLGSTWPDTVIAGFASDKMYVVETSAKVVQRCLLMTTDPGDLVLDPTCGSGTTAYVAEQWGRRWITIDTSRVALALARTRLMAARYPYYLLADTPEGMRKEAEVTGQAPPSPLPASEGDLRRGFVYKRVPHITLKSIANNEEIDTIHARYQEQLEPLRERLNTLLRQTWEDWQIPREPAAAWPADAAQVHAEWWRLRRERQAEIDASIARRADTELLVDQPYEDPKRVRVSGPFTVESLSPHRMLASTPEPPDTPDDPQPVPAAQSFEAMIIDTLRRAGVQNTRKAERLHFDSLEPFAGTWIHAAGTYTEADGTAQRVAVTIGGEHDTVGSQQIKAAAKEALKGAGFDVLIVCGFAFDAHASETAAEFRPATAVAAPEAPADDKKVAEAPAAYELRLGRLPVLLARMNPDLLVGDGLLKNTGAGNLFMVFGEPDIRIEPQPDGQLVVEVLGVDVYDPTTGQVRSSSTDDIACWFVDTDYNGESFFVRHAYFTGADEPYDKLKRALRAEIDEAAWAALYRTTSRPFPRPETGKIAVKVINHYGDEVLKVFDV